MDTKLLTLCGFLVFSLYPQHIISFEIERPKKVGSITPRVDTNKEMFCLAKVVYNEARGEPTLGKVAVAHVVLNRMMSKKYPDTICEVVHQRRGNSCQFSGMCKKEVHRFDANSLNIAHKVLVLKNTKDPTRGALYFHNNTVSPSWSSVYARTARIGNQFFYKPASK